MITDTLTVGHGSWPKITTAVDNDLISKMTLGFSTSIFSDICAWWWI